MMSFQSGAGAGTTAMLGYERDPKRAILLREFGGIQLEDLGEVLFKGKEQAIRVFAVNT